MVTKKSWDEFRETGLMLIINQFLHIFGWAIVVEMYDDKEGDKAGTVKTAYPARVKFRGFGTESTSKAYEKISKYMKENAEVLEKEAKEEEA